MKLENSMARFIGLLFFYVSISAQAGSNNPGYKIKWITDFGDQSFYLARNSVKIGLGGSIEGDLIAPFTVRTSIGTIEFPLNCQFTTNNGQYKDRFDFTCPRSVVVNFKLENQNYHSSTIYDVVLKKKDTTVEFFDGYNGRCDNYQVTLPKDVNGKILHLRPYGSYADGSIYYGQVFSSTCEEEVLIQGIPVKTDMLAFYPKGNVKAFHVNRACRLKNANGKWVDIPNGAWVILDAEGWVTQFN